MISLLSLGGKTNFNSNPHVTETQQQFPTLRSDNKCLLYLTFSLISVLEIRSPIPNKLSIIRSGRQIKQKEAEEAFIVHGHFCI